MRNRTLATLIIVATLAACAMAGDLVVFDQSAANTLTRYTATRSVVWATPLGHQCQKLEQGPDGFLYLGGWTNDRIHKVNPATGALLGDVAIDTSADRMCDFTFGPDHDGDGIADIYTTHLNTRIVQAWASSTDYTAKTLFTSEGLTIRANNLAFGPDLYGADGVPDLWVIDGEQNDATNMMRIYNGATGALQASWALDFIRVPHGLTWGSDGRFYVANSNRHQVNSYLPDGTGIRQDGIGISRDGMRYPRQTHEGYDGNWYVANRFAGDRSLVPYAVGSSNGAVLTYNADFTAFDSLFIETAGADFSAVIYLPHIASMPVPVNGAKVSALLDTLAWTNPDPNSPGETMTCDVYLSDNFPDYGLQKGDPNFMLHAVKIVDNEPLTSVNLPTLNPPVQLVYGRDYFWRVDTTDSEGTATGRVWKFTADNTPPQVNAGEDTFTWLTDGAAVVQMSPAIQDDGKPNPPAAVAVLWSLNQGNADVVTIDNAGIENATMTITATGDYTFRLDADDSQLIGFDTVLVRVFADACAAARAQPGYTPLQADVDNDCDVDLADLSIMASEWLLSNALQAAPQIE